MSCSSRKLIHKNEVIAEFMEERAHRGERTGKENSRALQRCDPSVVEPRNAIEPKSCSRELRASALGPNHPFVVLLTKAYSITLTCAYG